MQQRAHITDQWLHSILCKNLNNQAVRVTDTPTPIATQTNTVNPLFTGPLGGKG